MRAASTLHFRSHQAAFCVVQVAMPTTRMAHSFRQQRPLRSTRLYFPSVTASCTTRRRLSKPRSSSHLPCLCLGATSTCMWRTRSTALVKRAMFMWQSEEHSWFPRVAEGGNLLVRSCMLCVECTKVSASKLCSGTKLFRVDGLNSNTETMVSRYNVSLYREEQVRRRLGTVAKLHVNTPWG